MPAYIKAFLEEAGRSGSLEKTRYRCRVCGREWVKHTPEDKAEGERPSLVRVER